ncbi:hypothetical protein VN97_g10675 [Penicillium thymicola]|uniref:Uncharacterized protein n=1 Tax=Penicillium thymicola TaxID=293382 RepID=A0AAI9T8J2_PENTH|nr:hypothetical protein VN97_g10675 [Penicillium thymicola]
MKVRYIQIQSFCQAATVTSKDLKGLGEPANCLANADLVPDSYGDTPELLVEHKPHAGELVVGRVTTRESSLLYVFFLILTLITSRL